MVNENVICRDPNYGRNLGWLGEVDLEHAQESLTREARRMFDGWLTLKFQIDYCLFSI